MNAATVGDYTSPQQTLPSGEICYQAAPMAWGSSHGETVSTLTSRFFLTMYSSSEIVAGPYYPLPDYPPPDYPLPLHVGSAMVPPVKIPITRAHLAHCEVSLIMPISRKAIVSDNRAIPVPSRP